MNPKPGRRKFTAFVITMICFSGMVVFALCKVDPSAIDVPAFAVQLATGYSVVCGLFFGSNVLEHFANRNSGTDTKEEI